MQIDLEKREPRLGRLETTLAQTERTYLRLLLGGLVALALLIAASWGGYRFYRSWQESHLVKNAEASKAAGDLKTASLSARRALQFNPGSIGAMRVIAEIAEQTNDRAALDWRRKVWELKATNVDDGLALVRSAIWFRDLMTAEKTLKNLEPIASARPEFFAANAQVAELKRDASASEKNWARASELSPNESSYRFQLALVRLGSTDAAKRNAALAELEKLRADGKLRAAATRTLIIDGVSHKLDAARTLELAKELEGYPDAQFSDRILYLELLRQSNDPAYVSCLTRLKREVPDKASDCAALIAWMTRNKMTAEAAEFARQLPAMAAASWPVPLATAEALAQEKSWAELERLTSGKTWTGYDFLRRAFLSRALRGQEKQLAGDQELAAAEKEIASSPQALSLLTQVIADWGWQNEAVEMLWTLTKNPETKRPALQTLYEHYAKNLDASGLFRVLTKLLELSPQDRALQNNLAQVSLLLGADWERARKTAAELAMAEPANAAFVSTNAFALLTSGDAKGARQLLERLPEAQLREPSVALYYGLALAATGEKEKARAMLKLSESAQLFPEEKALVAKAENSLLQ